MQPICQSRARKRKRHFRKLSDQLRCHFSDVQESGCEWSQCAPIIQVFKAGVERFSRQFHQMEFYQIPDRSKWQANQTLFPTHQAGKNRSAHSKTTPTFFVKNEQRTAQTGKSTVFSSVCRIQTYYQSIPTLLTGIAHYLSPISGVDAPLGTGYATGQHHCQKVGVEHKHHHTTFETNGTTLFDCQKTI